MYTWDDVADSLVAHGQTAEQTNCVNGKAGDKAALRRMMDSNPLVVRIMENQRKIPEVHILFVVTRF